MSDSDEEEKSDSSDSDEDDETSGSSDSDDDDDEVTRRTQRKIFSLRTETSQVPTFTFSGHFLFCLSLRTMRRMRMTRTMKTRAPLRNPVTQTQTSPAPFTSLERKAVQATPPHMPLNPADQ